MNDPEIALRNVPYSRMEFQVLRYNQIHKYLENKYHIRRKGKAIQGKICNFCDPFSDVTIGLQNFFLRKK